VNVAGLGGTFVTEPTLPATLVDPPPPPELVVPLLEQAARNAEPPTNAAPYRKDLRDTGET
jgi:hypothetical protein